MQLTATPPPVAPRTAAPGSVPAPAAPAAPEQGSGAIARAQVRPRGFDPRVFDVVAGAEWTSGHATARDAMQAVWRLGNPYRVVGVVERADGFAVVDLLTADSAGQVLDELPRPHAGLDWLQRTAGSPLVEAWLMGDFGGPVRVVGHDETPLTRP